MKEASWLPHGFAIWTLSHYRQKSLLVCFGWLVFLSVWGFLFLQEFFSCYNSQVIRNTVPWMSIRRPSISLWIYGMPLPVQNTYIRNFLLKLLFVSTMNPSIKESCKQESREKQELLREQDCVNQSSSNEFSGAKPAQKSVQIYWTNQSKLSVLVFSTHHNNMILRSDDQCT